MHNMLHAAKFTLQSAIVGNVLTAKYLRHHEQNALEKGRIYLREAKDPDNENNKDDNERSEEFYNTYQNLRMRRTQQLRREQRLLYLAYAFMRDVPYSEVEETSKSMPDFTAVERRVFDLIDNSDDPRAVKQKFEEWVQAAKDIAPFVSQEKRAA